MDSQSPEGPGDGAVAGPPAQTEETVVRVIFFTDMKGSTALKEDLAERWDEQAFQRLRQEHDALLTDCITRDHAGQIIKATGDGFLAVFTKPSTAVERAMEIQEKLRGHPQVRVRIGIDMGEVRVESAGGPPATCSDGTWTGRPAPCPWPMAGTSASPARSTPMRSAGSRKAGSPGKSTASTA